MLTFRHGLTYLSAQMVLLHCMLGQIKRIILRDSYQILFDFLCCQFANRVTHSSFGLEKPSQSDFQESNAVKASSVANSLLKTLLQEDSNKPASDDKECHTVHNNTFCGKELGNMSQIRSNLFLMKNTNNKVNYHKTSEAFEDRLPVDCKLTSPCGFNLPGYNLSEANMSANRNLEIFDWSTVGVVADANNHRDSSDTSDSTHKVPTSDSNFLNSPEQCKRGDLQSPNTLHVKPRKRPRKSTPRKVDPVWQNSCSGSHSTDSEGTASADEVPSESPRKLAICHESPNDSVPVSSFRYRFSPRSDEESSGGTKVLFKRTAGNVLFIAPY